MDNNEINTIINLCNNKGILKGFRDIIDLFGITLMEEENYLINSSLIVNDKEKVITVNKDLSEITKNYYIILEIIEYLLHYNLDNIFDIKINIGYDTDVYRIANELLISNDKFILIYNSLIKDNYSENEIISILVRAFNVPREVIINKIYVLNNSVKKKVLD